MKPRMIASLANLTCNGVPSLSVYSCVQNGTVCSNNGNCSTATTASGTSATCVCSSGWEGQYCNETIPPSSSSSQTTVILAATLATAIPLLCFALLILAGVALVVYYVERSRGRQSEEWEISPDEIEMSEQLGQGGYGAVYKAKWRGTEVAVKTVPSEKVTHEMARNFKEEVRIMMKLRHPNVVLFMAASTKAEHMLIVMEFMSLGSLFDLLHNELLPDIPFVLKIKMAYHAAKGMHFLHSSGIVHRDLKSLNLLLDSKWNVKVSDFGLTKLRDELKKDANQANTLQGTVHWMAPEVLNESLDADYLMADVYAFGIILWELHTRQQPYFGLSPAAVAVSVIRDNVRPPLPDEDDESLSRDYRELITSCWHSDPLMRPTFLEAMTRLSEMAHNDDFTRSESGSQFSKSHSPYNSSRSDRSSDSSSEFSGSVYSSMPMTSGRREDELKADSEVAIVISDMSGAAALWEHDAEAMRDATIMHNNTLRAMMVKHRGHEVTSVGSTTTTSSASSGGGLFCVAFGQVSQALEWCGAVQQALLLVDWPASLVPHEAAGEEFSATKDDLLLFKGVRVRMGVHVGRPKAVRDPMTRRMEYSGPVVDEVARLATLAQGGQVLVSSQAHSKLRSEGHNKEDNSNKKQKDKQPATTDEPAANNEPHHWSDLVERPCGGSESHSVVYELKVKDLEDRFFDDIPSSSDGVHQHQDIDDNEAKQLQEEEEEDRYLSSANLARWLINFSEVQMGRQLGMGSYGVVFKCKWKGIEVAVKRIIKQKMGERQMLDFRAEVAHLASIQHPNIVMCIGACVVAPNISIVTEFVKQGALKEILANNAIRLVWPKRLNMLRSAALGIAHLHGIGLPSGGGTMVHSNLKPSNLLVDENWNVKVGDFGLTNIKRENATTTKCGMPCWLAPEVLRGEAPTEKADVYVFGIIMWQVLTRREPFAGGGANFMSVALEVLEGKRPPIPPSMSELAGGGKPFKKLMKRCWHEKSTQRPSMDEVVTSLSALLEAANGEVEGGGM